MKKLLLLIALVFALPACAEEEPLRVSEAFQYEVEMDSDQLKILWDVAPGYYLYRHRFALTSTTPGVTFGELDIPDGKKKVDEFFGEVEVYRGLFEMSAPIVVESGNPLDLTFDLESQGCADLGLCYPPQTWQVSVPLASSTVLSKPSTASVIDLLKGASSGSNEFLPVEEAFQVDLLTSGDDTLVAQWRIADGYYLYQKDFSAESLDTSLQLGEISFSKGKKKVDEYFGEVVVYYDEATVTIPILSRGSNALTASVSLGYQGCAEDGICYPPSELVRDIELPAIGAAISRNNSTSNTSAPSSGVAVSESDRLASIVRDGNLLWVLLTFFVIGLGLAFTPCVLPMVPILSGIIAGAGENLTTARATFLSVIYVLAMALTYTVAGWITAKLGQNVQAIFQNPYVIVTFCLIFVAFAMSMFDVFQLQMPASIQNKLTAFSNKQKGGSPLGVGIMGVLSALIVGPCVAAPLAGVLIVIGQSGNELRGALTLFVLSLGMGAPLIAFGATAGKAVPKAGAWMDTIKQIFGILFLALAVWMLSRIIQGPILLILWAFVALMTALVLRVFNPLEKIGFFSVILKSISIASLVYAVILIVGAAAGNDDPLKPLAKLGGGSHTAAAEQHVTFAGVKSLDDLDLALAKAGDNSQITMLDFYADWCVECIHMEKKTFSDADVISALAGFSSLQADVTKNDSVDKELMAHFGIIGPPSILFFDRNGNELRHKRIVGFLNSEDFLNHIADL